MNDVTETLNMVVNKILNEYGRPKAILSISAHWYMDDTYIQSALEPKQIYDMYGFPKELYNVKYSPKGFIDLTNRVLKLLGSDVKINDKWGIDYGSWSILMHMFPKCDIPVVQLSISNKLSNEEILGIGKKLSCLKD